MFIDSWGLYYAQTIYDYLLDRYGIMVGFLRQGLLVSSFICLMLNDSFFISSESDARYVMYPLMAIYLLALGFMLYVHSGEITFQKKKNYMPLNMKAMMTRESPFNKFFRLFAVFFLVLNFGLVIADLFIGMDSYSSLINMLFYITLGSWFYMDTVFIRDRDEKRFKKHKLAYQEN